MRARYLKIPFLFVFPVLLGACATTKVDYRASSVPEEDGLTFTRITESTERVDVAGVYPPGVDDLHISRRSFDVSRDGLRIAYISQGGPSILNVKQLADQKCVQVPTSPWHGGIMSVAFSPDSRSIAFTALREGHQDICLVGVDSTAPPRRVGGEAETVFQIEFSPAGQFIFSSVRRFV